MSEQSTEARIAQIIYYTIPSLEHHDLDAVGEAASAIVAEINRLVAEEREACAKVAWDYSEKAAQVQNLSTSRYWRAQFEPTIVAATEIYADIRDRSTTCPHCHRPHTDPMVCGCGGCPMGGDQ